MIHERFDGVQREVTWGELQELSNRAAHLLEAHGVVRGDRVAVVLPATPETAAIFFGTWKLGGCSSRCRSCTATTGSHIGSATPAAVLVTDETNAPRFEASGVPLVVLTADLLAEHPAEHVTADTAADDPAQLYYTSGTTGLAKGIVHAHRYLLGHEEFVYCHEVEDGERFHGMGEWAWAAGIAPLLGPWRLGAVQCVYQREGGFDPHRQLDFLSRHRVTNVFTTPTAMRSMMAVDEAGTRYPCSFRRVCSAGEPLNPEAIRWFRQEYDITVLDYYGLTESYPLVRTTPGWTCARARWDDPCPAGTSASSTRTNKRYRAASGERSASARARTRTIRSATGGTRRRSARRSAASWFHSKDAAFMDEDGYVWYAGRSDDVIISAGYRIGPFEVESACIEHPAVREAAAVASPDERRGAVVKAFVILAAGNEASDELAQEIADFVRVRLPNTRTRGASSSSTNCPRR